MDLELSSHPVPTNAAPRAGGPFELENPSELTYSFRLPVATGPTFCVRKSVSLQEDGSPAGDKPTPLSHSVRQGNNGLLQNTIDKTGKLAFISADSGLFRVNSSRLAAHYAGNAQTFSGRIHRLLGVGLMRSIRPIVGLWNPRLATRLIHFPLRGTSRDRSSQPRTGPPPASPGPVFGCPMPGVQPAGV